MAKSTKKRPEQNAMGILREELLKRDGFRCVPCVVLGPCDPKGIGWCGGNQLLASDLAPAVYFKLDALRAAFLRLEYGHLHGKRHDEWRNGCAQCPCHNIGMTKEVRAACLAYTEQFPETGTERFEAALARRPAERAAKKEKAAKALHASYQKAVAKHGKPKIPTRPMTPKPAAPKKGGSKWAWAPIHPTYLKPVR